MWDPKILGVSLLTILVVVGAFWLGRKTTVANFLPVIG
jgi:hypothetical protein